MHWIYAHLIGDYLLQTDWMAKSKKQKSWVCAAHVLTYLLPFLLCGLPAWKLAAIGVQHFLQDRTNIVAWSMKWSGRSTFASPPFAPWSIILTDNIFHVLFIGGISSI